MFGRRKTVTLSDRLAMASPEQMLALLAENLMDRATFGKHSSVRLNSSIPGELTRTEDYELCLNACRHEMSAGHLVKAAAAWARDSDRLKRIAAADLLNAGFEEDDPACRSSLDVLAKLSADRDTMVVLAVIEALEFRLSWPEDAEDFVQVINDNCTSHHDRLVRDRYADVIASQAGDDDMDEETQEKWNQVLPVLENPAAEHDPRLVAQAEQLWADHSRTFFSSIMDRVGEHDLAESMRTGGASDRARLEQAGLAGPDLGAKLKKASIIELFRMHALANSCFESGNAAKIEIGDEIRRRPGDEVKRAAESWVAKEDMRDRWNLEIVSAFLSQDRAVEVRWKLEGRPACPPDVAGQIKGLDSSDDHLVNVSLAALEKALGNDPSLLARLGHCERHPKPYVRAWFVRRSKYPKTPEALALLIRMSSDPDYDVRSEAVSGLVNAEMDKPELRDALCAVLENDDREEIPLRMLAIDGLARRDDPRAIEAVERELQMDPMDLMGEYELFEMVCELVSQHARRRYVRGLERWRESMESCVPDDCDPEWIEPVIATMKVCAESARP